MRAMMLAARTRASRTAFCAVGGCGRAFRSGPLLEPPARISPHLRGHFGEQPILQLDEVGADLAFVELAVVAPPQVAGKLVDLPSRLDARQPAAPDHEGELSLPLAGIGFE